MGVASFNIATSVNLVIAQRLARRLCKNCKKPINIPKQSLLELGFTDADLDNPDNIIHEPVAVMNAVKVIKDESVSTKS